MTGAGRQFTTDPRRPQGVGPFGIPRRDLRDAYHFVLSLSWPQFFAAVFLSFLAINLGFAALYALGDAPVRNARPGSFVDLFFFSVETFATVGYDNLSPATLYGHSIAALEILCGLMSMALVTGLVFARFAKPSARLLFSHVVTVTEFEGKPTLMLRIANRRQNYIIEAQASLTLIWRVQTSEGFDFRRFYELELVRERSPAFSLSWTIMHVIDERSPLFGADAAALAAREARLLLTVIGTDEILAAPVHARHEYSVEDIRHGHRFADIIERMPDGTDVMHLDRFHDTVPVAPRVAG